MGSFLKCQNQIHLEYSTDACHLILTVLLSTFYHLPIAFSTLLSKYISNSVSVISSVWFECTLKVHSHQYGKCICGKKECTAFNLAPSNTSINCFVNGGHPPPVSICCSMLRNIFSVPLSMDLISCLLHTLHGTPATSLSR